MGKTWKFTQFEVLKQREISKVSPFPSYPPMIAVTSHECMSFGEKRSTSDIELLLYEGQ